MPKNTEDLTVCYYLPKDFIEDLTTWYYLAKDCVEDQAVCFYLPIKGLHEGPGWLHASACSSSEWRTWLPSSTCV